MHWGRFGACFKDMNVQLQMMIKWLKGSPVYAIFLCIYKFKCLAISFIKWSKNLRWFKIWKECFTQSYLKFHLVLSNFSSATILMTIGQITTAQMTAGQVKIHPLARMTCVQWLLGKWHLIIWLSVLLSFCWLNDGWSYDSWW